MGPPRGRRNFNKGPLLPNSLATELDVSGGGAGGRKGRGAPGKQLAGRKHARKAAREAKKQGRLAYQQLRRSGKRPADEEVRPPPLHCARYCRCTVPALCCEPPLGLVSACRLVHPYMC